MRGLKTRKWINILVVVFALIFLVGVALSNEPGRLTADSTISITPAFGIEIPMPPISITTPAAITALPIETSQSFLLGSD